MSAVLLQTVAGQFFGVKVSPAVLAIHVDQEVLLMTMGQNVSSYLSSSLVKRDARATSPFGPDDVSSKADRANDSSPKRLEHLRVW